MKTSTRIAAIGIAGCFIITTAANFRLKKEYTDGNLQDPFVQQALPSFRFIKDATDTASFREARFEIHVGESETSSVANYFNDKAPFVFEVLNDTLYIRTNPEDKRQFSHWTPVVFRTKHLANIDVSSSQYGIESGNTDTLSVIARNKAEVALNLEKINTLSIYATGNASVSASAKDTLNQVNIRLEDKSSFHAKNILTNSRSLQLGNKTSFQLSGNSIANFGLRNTQ